jgi:hypothetical protein
MRHPAELDHEQLLAQCRVERGRSGGPGGQHRNKVETAVVLHHEPTGVQAHADERRSQEVNRKIALRRLRIELALRIRREVDPFAGPSDLWTKRTPNRRIVLSPKHHDFAPMLAEALDVVVDRSYDVKAAAAWLGVSMSQLVKLLRHEPKALSQINAERQRRGLRTMK